MTDIQIDPTMGEGTTIWKDESWQAPPNDQLSDQGRKFMEFYKQRSIVSMHGMSREDAYAWAKEINASRFSISPNKGSESPNKGFGFLMLLESAVRRVANSWNSKS